MEAPLLQQHHHRSHMFSSPYNAYNHHRQITPPAYVERPRSSQALQPMDYYSRPAPSQSRYPPTPPAERPQKLLLPPISTLLNLSNGRDVDTSTHQSSQFTTRLSQDTNQYPPQQDSIRAQPHQRRPSPSRLTFPLHGHAPVVQRPESDEQTAAAHPPHSIQSSASSPGLSMQRPLPRDYHPEVPNFGPRPRLSPPMSAPLTSSSGWSTANLPHHSHHISNSSATSVSFPGSSAASSNLPSPSSPSSGPHSAGSMPSTSGLPDRYICPSCSKAFSRPSSLRIHVHSHTGEKPFRCPHDGCGKAFSVRSNMKRHQRGCHVSGGITISAFERMDVNNGIRIMLPGMASPH